MFRTIHYVILKTDGDTDSFVYDDGYNHLGDTDTFGLANFYSHRKHAEKDMRRYAKDLLRQGVHAELQVAKVLLKGTLSGCVVEPKAA